MKQFIVACGSMVLRYDVTEYNLCMMSLYVGPIGRHSILNKLVCEVDRMENSLSLSFHLYAMLYIIRGIHSQSQCGEYNPSACG